MGRQDSVGFAKGSKGGECGQSWEDGPGENCSNSVWKVGLLREGRGRGYGQERVLACVSMGDAFVGDGQMEDMTIFVCGRGDRRSN